MAGECARTGEQGETRCHHGQRQSGDPRGLGPTIAGEGWLINFKTGEEEARKELYPGGFDQKSREYLSSSPGVGRKPSHLLRSVGKAPNRQGRVEIALPCRIPVQT